MKGLRHPENKNIKIGFIGENKRKQQTRQNISIRISDIQRISKEQCCEKNKLNTDFCEFDT